MVGELSALPTPIAEVLVVVPMLCGISHCAAAQVLHGSCAAVWRSIAPESATHTYLARVPP